MVAGAAVAAASGPGLEALGAAAIIGSAEAVPKESCPTRLAPSVKMKMSMATAEAHESTGTRRGTGGRIPAILGVKVKLRGARRWEFGAGMRASGGVLPARWPMPDLNECESPGASGWTGIVVHQIG